MAEKNSRLGIGGAAAGVVLFFLPSAGIALFVSAIGAVAWGWPFFTALLWIFGIVYGALLVLTFFRKDKTDYSKIKSYAPGYIPNLHQPGTQEYYLNEIMNQQAVENDRKRRQVD